MKRTSVNQIHLLDRATRLALRSCLLRSLSFALSYPTVERFRDLQSSLKACVQLEGWLEPKERVLLSSFAAAVAELGPDGYEAEFLRVFTHVCAADCNPCETAYTAKHIFQASQNLATITGIYKSFGLEAGGERQDHIAVELEFLAFLRYRESRELSSGKLEGVEAMRRGQSVFIDRHLGRWVGTFCVLLQQKASNGALLALAALLEQVIASEAQEHSLLLPEVSETLTQSPIVDERQLSPLTMAQGSFSDGVFHA